MQNSIINTDKIRHIASSGKSDVQQLDMGLKTPKFQPLRSINRRLRQVETRLEVMPFWKSFSFVFMFFSSIVVPAIVLLVMITNFDTLPQQIGMFYDPTEKSSASVDTSIIIIFPIIYSISDLFLLNLIYNVFNYDRRLAQIISVTINIANILFLIAFMQILSVLII